MKDRIDQDLTIAISTLGALPWAVVLLRLAVPGSASSFRLLFSNARMHDLLGRDLTPLHGTAISSAMPEVASEALLERCLQALRTQRTVEPDRATQGNASIGTTATRIVPLSADRVMLVLEDGPSAPPESEALMKLAQRSKWLLDASPDAMVITNGEGIIQMVNAHAELIFGYSRAELLGRSVELLMPRAVHARHRGHVERYAQAPGQRMMGQGRELVGRRKDGSEFPIEVALSPMEMESGLQVAAAVRDITDRRAAQDAKRHFDAILGSSQDAIISKDLRGLITAWNPGAEQVFGYGAEEVIGKPMDMLYASDRAVVERAVERAAVDSGHAQSMESVRLRRDGTRVDVIVTVSPIRDEHGTIIGSSDTAHVITERKTAQQELLALNRTLEQRVKERSEALIASEKRFHDTLDKMMEGVQLIDPEWRYVYVNDALVAQSTFEREQLLGRTMMEMYPGIEHTPIFAALQKSMSDGQARTLDNDFEFPNGHKGTFHLSIQPMSNGLFILSTDITERKRAEQALRASEARYHNALDVLIEGAQIIGHDWRHLYVNDALAEMSTFSKEELLGTTLMERYPGVEQSDIFKELQRCMVERSTHTVETDFTFPNGVTKSLYLRIQPVDEGLFILAQDITERKRAEMEMAAQRQQLKEQNQELEQFTYIASHDLQEPLRMVASYVQLLQRRYGDALDGDAHEFIGFAVDGAQRMKQLIDDLLTYSRVDRPTRQQAVDMNSTVEMAVANLGSAIAEAGAQVLAEDLPHVQASRTDMLQVMQNLIGNAVKFRREGTVPEVLVKGREEAAHWYFEVIDNGIGVEPTYHDKIFAPFKRLHGRSKYTGSGIGLAIAQKIVHRYGGRIWCTSEPGKGSTFQFTIPRQRT
jgi:PAS domain S-box-containing protein